MHLDAADAVHHRGLARARMHRHGSGLDPCDGDDRSDRQVGGEVDEAGGMIYCEDDSLARQTVVAIVRSERDKSLCEPRTKFCTDKESGIARLRIHERDGPSL